MKLIFRFVVVVFLGILFLSAPKLTKAQNILFQDNFETDNTSQWSVIHGNWQRSFIQGSMRYGLNLNSSSSISEVEGGDFNWSDYEFSFDMLPISGIDRNVFFRVTPQRSLANPSLDMPITYSLHMYPNRIWLQKWILNEGFEPVNYAISLPDNTVTHFRILLVGNRIRVFIANNPTPTIDYIDDNNPILSGKIGLAITTGASLSEVWFDNVVVTEIPTETPTPSPSPSPSPTPTPTPTPTPSPTPTPVTKVFLIPGTGASWNVDALINCKDSGYSGSWTMAPYAKNVYSQLLSSLASAGWDLTTFNYDWRKQVPENSALFSNFINSNVDVNEKVDIVGHSLGGLIGRSYLENQNGGKASKLLTVGSPHKGLALAYPAVVGGEIWANDLVERIAATLLFKHCGVPASFKNMLPIYDYLRDFKTSELKDVNTMKTKNDYLPTNFVSPFWGVKVGTLAGTGKSTLKIIDVIKNSSWPDGKPIRKENVNEGDGMVLVDSAQIPGATSNEVINQSHSGIIASTEGVSKILEFFGSPGIADPPYLDPASALVLVGYPGNFWVTDKNGTTIQSDNGMVAIMNPNDGDYRLQIIPTSDTTSFIVAQFLPNGKTLYKEYKFKGLKQKIKLIEFSSENPEEDILTDKGEPKDTHSSKPGFDFWRYFNKFHK
ncbi:MAG: hypothetical protein HYV90_03350 [Candidatus Woesebacteria bacterium]|nr:MAG: hypothetical protein HYV90_03350 [Candidatus Woesebacteria bacterium]